MALHIHLCLAFILSYTLALALLFFFDFNIGFCLQFPSHPPSCPLSTLQLLWTCCISKYAFYLSGCAGHCFYSIASLPGVHREGKGFGLNSVLSRDCSLAICCFKKLLVQLLVPLDWNMLFWKTSWGQTNSCMYTLSMSCVRFWEDFS